MTPPAWEFLCDDPPELAWRAVVKSVEMDEPFDEAADVRCLGQVSDEGEGVEPGALVAGRRVVDQAGQVAVLLEHVLVVPRYEHTGLGLATADAWAAHVRDHVGIPRLLAAIPKHKDRRAITRLALLWGFRQYAVDEETVWYVRDISGGET